MRRVTAMAAIGLSLFMMPATAASLTKTYSYFSIKGSTIDEIEKELSAHGPNVAMTGRRHPGATQLEFVTKLDYKEISRGCIISRARVQVKASVILPKWRGTKEANGLTRLIWNTLAADIKRHEESHVVIAKNHAREMEDRLLKSGRHRDCKAARTFAAGIVDRVITKHDQAQADFDRIEAKNFERRLMSLMQYRLERAQSAMK
ncbi:DUF922 domain-containing Zn-dependent protease [Limoniibacter endophyticus]|uniref:Peptidase n=1 Tax=Limoniibacter endophyticus TaxID=1565040 RepID=A0A8J3DDL9_9HYPH|nr:DUF922 domain-containing protein [Limoniibacter endophyticus]GHC60480.1 peptidase [Limoniibacter endophyticus]